MCRRLPTRLLALALVAVSCHTIAGTPAGNLDPTFGAEHTGIVRRGFDLDATHPYEWDDFGLGLVVDGAGRLLMAGVAQAEDDDCLGLMRFTADGRVDPAYGTNGKTCLPMDPGFEAWFLGGLRIAVGPDGGSYVAGILEFDDGTALVVCRLDAQGGPVTSFGTQNTGCTAVPGIKLLFASAIPPPLVAGDVLFLIADTIFDDGYGPAVTRLDAASGAVIPFGSDQNVPLIPVTTSYSQMLDATMTSDGRIVVVGGLEDETENLDALVVAFDPGTGTLDTDFDGDGMLIVSVDGVESGRNYATSVSLQDDDTLLVAGPYETAAASGIAVVRIDAGTGVLDTSHGEPVIKYDPCADTPQGCDLQVKRATITDSGRIALGGDVGEGEDRRMFAARLLSDGTPDSDFGSQQGIRYLVDVGLGPASASDMIVQGDRIVLGGMARRTQAVFVDNTFQQVSHVDYAMVRLGDGSIFKDQFEP